MKKTTLREIIKVIDGQLILGNDETVVEKIVQDSRLVTDGSLFFAIVGDNANGHLYLSKALENGAKALIISDRGYFDKKEFDKYKVDVILVDDTKQALKNLAHWYLEQIKVFKVAVTGSVGKTTTRDLIYSVCEQTYITHKTKGNYNSEIGAALASLDADEKSQVAVLEMGMDRKNEIHSIASYVRPDVAVITNVGLSHIERLGSRENIYLAKMEIIDYADENTRLIVYKDDFLNRENIESYIRKNNLKPTMLTVVGEDSTCDVIFKDYKASNTGGEFTLKYVDKSEETFKLNLLGKHNAQNASLAVCVGKVLNLEKNLIERGLQNTKLTSNRLEIKKVKGITVIDDAYNASPSSMKASLDVLNQMKGRKIAVLADMKELGEYSEQYHREVGIYAQNIADIVLSIGDMAKYISDKNHFDSKKALLSCCIDLAKEGDTFLFKGSRSMGLDEISKRFLEELTK